MVGSNTAVLSRLLGYDDKQSLTTALRGSFLAGIAEPRVFLQTVEEVVRDAGERLEGASADSPEAGDLKDMLRKLRIISDFTQEFLAALA
jgi:hypothetical protein